MLPKHLRLRASTDITHVYRKGKRCNREGVFLSACHNSQTQSRIAIVVGKKFSLRASRRNRQKRILSAALETLTPSCVPGYDIVISYTKRESLLSYKESCVIVKNILQSCNLIAL